MLILWYRLLPERGNDMEMEDDRTEAEKQSHCCLVGGTDSFLSGWGKAEGGKSYAFWACKPDDEWRVLRWVEKRGDIKRIRIVGKGYNPSGNGHCHIYVVAENHPAVQ